MSTSTDDPDFLKIDEDRLDAEWLKQPELYYRHAVDAAKAQSSRDNSKAEVDITHAELDEAIRSNPQKYGIEKITEAAVKAAIQKHARYQAASDELIACQYRLNIRQAALSALEHKKRALTMLVSLYESNYFADPKVQAGRKVREAMDNKQQVRVAKKTQIQRELAGED